MGADINEITQRILKYAEETGMMGSDLARDLGVKPQNITPMKKNITGIPAKRLFSFLEKHRDLSLEWALFGEGEMFTKPVRGKKMEVDRKGNIVFKGESVAYEVDKLEIKRLKDLLEEKDKHLQSLKEMIDLFKSAKDWGK